MEEFGKRMVVFKQPTDMSVMVQKTSQNLKELMAAVNTCSETKDKGDVTIDQQMIDEIISAINELDGERQWLHQAIEEETIKSSVLRHKMSDFPRETRWEIDAACKVARAANENTMQEYKEKIQRSNEKFADLKEKRDYYKTVNAQLEKQRDELQAGYNGTCEKLNETLLKKADMLKKLTKTKEKLHGTKEEIEEYRKAFLELNKDMVTERCESNAEQRNLQNEISQTIVKLRQQEKVNLELQGKFDVVHHIQLVGAQHLSRAEKKVREREKVNGELQEQLDEQCQLLTEKVEGNAELTTQRNAASQGLRDLADLHQKEEARLTQEIDNVVSQLGVVRMEFENLTKQKIQVEMMLEAESRSEQHNNESMEDTIKKLRLNKEELLLYSTECARMKKQNEEVQGAVEKVQREHLAAVEILVKEIDHLTESLEAEVKEKHNLQERYNEVIKQANEYVREFNDIATMTIESIEQGKSKHGKTSVVGQTLQKKLKKIEISIKSKEDELIEVKAKYIEMQKRMKGDMSRFQNSIANLKSDLHARETKYNDMEPGFLKLQEDTSLQQQEFQKLKRHVVEMKTHKGDLEESLEEKEKKLEDIALSTSKLTEDANEARKMFICQLNRENEVISSLERTIYKTDERLSAVSTQNDRFKHGVDYFNREIEIMEKSMAVMGEGKENIDVTIEEYRGWLETQWRKHMALDKMYHDQDILMLDDIKRVEDVSSDRARKVLQIHRQLEHHLAALSKFIENVSNMRGRSRRSMVKGVRVV